jgi:3-methyladenine DNA glycosylase AlkD
MIKELKKDLKALSGTKVKDLQRFFKTGKGEYGEGDIFIGVTMPNIRIVAKRYLDISFNELQELLESGIHEYRMIALLILTYIYPKAEEKQKEKIYKFYIKNTKYINNWDLVDVTCPRIVGEHLLNRNKDILYTFAKSKDLWKKRIAILATLTFIREKQFEDTLKISEILLNDKHDLIHKAVGWMLRELGKKDQKTEEEFLKKHCLQMPRTMLRYAIEKFEEKKRQAYLKGNV